MRTLKETDSKFPEIGSDDLPLTPLAREFYTSEGWYQRDIERVFRRRWLFVCHVSEIPNQGDYTTFEIGGDSIIVARDQRGAVNAFHNVCRHRGSALCEPGRGNKKAFVCPFHAWTYNLDGTLRAAAYMPGLDRSLYGAKRVWSEVWNGMIFINLSQAQPKPVAEHLKSVDFAGHQLHRTKVIATRDYLNRANWKINGETFQECYHCKVVHADTLAKILTDTTNHTAYQDTGSKLGDGEFMIYAPDLRDGALIPGALTQTRDGKLVSKRLLGAGELQPPRLVSWFPNFSVAAFPDYSFIIDWIPLSATETNFRTRWLVHEDAVEGVDYAVQEVLYMADAFNIEDKIIVEVNQRGVDTTAYVPGPYHIPLEDDTRKYIASYVAHVKD